MRTKKEEGEAGNRGTEAFKEKQKKRRRLALMYLKLFLKASFHVIEQHK